MSYNKEQMQLSDLQSFLDGKGSRDFDDYQDVIPTIIKFMDALSDGYNTLTLKDIRKKIQTMPVKEVELTYNKYAKQTLTFNQIMSQIDKIVMLLEMFKRDNKNYFNNLHKQSKAFSVFLKELKHSKQGSHYDPVIEEIYDKFKHLDQLLKVIVDTEQHLDYSHELGDQQEDPLLIMGNRLRTLEKLLKSVQIKKSDQFKQLLDKYTLNLSNEKYTQTNWNDLLKIIKAFPLYISSSKLTPEDFKEFITALSSFVRLPGRTVEKKQIIQKIKLMFEKVSTKMKGGSSQVQQVRDANYERIYITNIFREQIQAFYYDIAKCLQQTANQRFVPAIKKIGYVFRPIIQDLQQIYNFIINHQIIDDNFTEFIVYINERAIQQFHIQEEQPLRIHFEHIMQSVKLMINECKNIEDYHHTDATDFVASLNKLYSILAQFVKYLKNIEKMVDIDVEKLNSIAIPRDQIADSIKTDIPFMINNIMHIYDDYLNAYQMYNNIDVVQKELKNLKLDQYQENTMKIAKNQVDNMKQYYSNIRQLYNDPSITYNPVLTQYMQNMTLRFQQCQYISKGISSSASLNPRYLVADDHIQNNPQMNRLVGLTEELGEGLFKTEGVRYQHILPEQNIRMPICPESMRRIENDNLDSIHIKRNQSMLLYQKNMQNVQIFDILPNMGTLTYQVLVDPLGITAQIRNNIIRVGAPPIARPFTQNQLDRIYGTIGVNRLVVDYVQITGILQNLLLITQQEIQTLQAQQNGQRITVACFNDNAMKEYLLPEMQIPFMQPIQKLLYYNVNDQFNQDQPGDISSYISPLLQPVNMAHHYVMQQNQYDDSIIYNQNASLVNLCNDPAQVFRNSTQYVEFRDNQQPFIASILGYHQSIPVQHLDNQSFGLELNQDIAIKIGRVKNIVDRRPWGVLDHIPRNLVYNHHLTNLTLDNPFNQLNRYTSVFNFDNQQCPIGGCLYNTCHVFRNPITKHMQYQVFMSQQLQYFTLQNVKNIFDPMVRKQLYKISNKAYFGYDLVPNLSREYDLLDNQNINHTLSRQFGEPGQQNGLMIPQYGLLRRQDVPNDIMGRQPRSQLSVALPETRNNEYRTQFIQLCNKVDEKIVVNGILKVNQLQLNKLLIALGEHVNGMMLRSFLSESIRIQYHNNYKICQGVYGINEETVIQQNNEVQHQIFKELVDRVIKIKTEGYAAVVILMNLANKMIDEQQQKLVSNSFEKKDKMLLQMRKMLMKFYNNNNFQVDWNDLGLTADDLQFLGNANQYLSSYTHNSDKKSQMKDERLQMIGGAYEFNVNRYYEIMNRYVNAIENYVVQGKYASNFAELFGLFAELEQNSVDNLEQTKETIKQAIYHYFMATMIDINESVMQYDFKVSLQPIERGVNQVMLRNTQLHVDCKQGSNMKLIGIDSIFIPQNWLTSNTDQANNTGNLLVLVPQFESQVSRDFNQMFLQTVDAMCQKMINYIGMYRLIVKKNQPFNIHRLSLGAAKKKPKSINTESSQRSQQSITFDVLDNKKKISLHQYESYYRLILVCQYYHQLFNDIGQAVRQANPGDNSVLVYHFAPQGQSIESKIYNFVIQRINGLILNFNVQSMQQYMQLVNGLMTKLNSTYYYDVVQAMILFVNKNYGIVNDNDLNKITQLNDQHDQRVQQMTLGVQQLLNRHEISENNLNSIPLDEHLQYLSPLIQNINRDQESNYNVHIYRLIQITIQNLNNLMEHQGVAVEERQSIHRMIQARYDMLNMQNVEYDDYVQNMIDIVNNGLMNVNSDINSPLRFHEQTMFSYHIFQLIQTQIALFHQATRSEVSILVRQPGQVYQHLALQPPPNAINLVQMNTNYDQNSLPVYIERVIQISNLLNLNGMIVYQLVFDQLYDQQGNLRPLVAPLPAGETQFTVFCRQVIRLDARQLIQRLKSLANSIKTQIRLYNTNNEFIRDRINQYNNNPANIATPLDFNDEQHRNTIMNAFFADLNQNIIVVEANLSEFQIVIAGVGMKGGSKGKYMELVGETKQIANIVINKGDVNSMYDTQYDILFEKKTQQQPTLKQPTYEQPATSISVKIQEKDIDTIKIYIGEAMIDDATLHKVNTLKQFNENQNTQTPVRTIFALTEDLDNFTDDSIQFVPLNDSSPNKFEIIDSKQPQSLVIEVGKVKYTIDDIITKRSDLNGKTIKDIIDKMQGTGLRSLKGGYLNINVPLVPGLLLAQELNRDNHTLIQKFDFDYSILGAYSMNSTHEIFLCSKIIRELISDCKWVLKIQDVFGHLLKSISVGSNVVNRYSDVYTNIIPSDIQITQNIIRMNNVPAINVRVPDQYVRNGVTINNMIRHLLYDGSHTTKDHIQFMDIHIHNDLILSQIAQGNGADQISLITSSLVNYLVHWQQQNKDKDSIPISTIISQMDVNDLTTLVSSAVSCKQNLEQLLYRLQQKATAQQSISSQLANASRQQNDIALRNQLNIMRQQQQSQLMINKRLISFIKSGVIVQLDEIIKNNIHILPDYFTITKNDSKQQGLISNLIHLVDYRQQQISRCGRIGQQQNESQLLAFSKFIYLMSSENNVSTQALKIDNMYVNYETMVKILPFIKALMSTQQFIKNSAFNHDYHMAYQLLYQMSQVIAPATIQRVDVRNQFSRPYWVDPGNPPVIPILAPIPIPDESLQDYQDIVGDPLYNGVMQKRRHIFNQRVAMQNDTLQAVQYIDYIPLFNSQFIAIPNAFMVQPIEYKQFMYQVYPQNGVAGMPRDLRAINASIYSINQNILQEISIFINVNANVNNIVNANIREIGIVPINMNMIKRDAGMVNISLYSQVFNNLLNMMIRPYEGQPPNVLLQLNQQLTDKIGSQVNLVDKLIINPADNNLKLIELQTYGQLLVQLLQGNGRERPGAVIDLIQQGMHVKINFVLYMMVIHMIQGIIPNNTDFYLNDMLEVLLQNPAVAITQNRLANRANRQI